MKKIIYGFIVIITIIGFSGCSSIGGIQIPENYESILPEQAKLNVTRILQNDNYSCATASLAMVMDYQDNKDVEYDPDYVWKQSKSSDSEVLKRGNDISGLDRLAKLYGFKNYEFVQNLQINELKYLITQDIPVLINIRNYKNSSSSHAVVVIGYDKKGFFINDPSYRNWDDGYHIDNNKFKNNWWANLSFPRGKAYQSAYIIYKNKGTKKHGKLYEGVVKPNDKKCFSYDASIKIIINKDFTTNSMITFDNWQYEKEYEKLSGQITNNIIEMKNENFNFKGKLDSNIIKGSYSSTNKEKCSGTFETN